VVGREFTAVDVVALLDPDAAPTSDAHLATLSNRGFVRPRGNGLFGFQHVLVQEAVYRSAPKRLRAELHERYADRLDTDSPDLPDLDEFVGYHLEQAYRLRAELGESDRRTEQLAEDAGGRLGEAGIRAAKRGDVPTELALLRRAIELLPRETLRRALMCELGIALNGAGRSDEAVAVQEQAIQESVESDDRVVELRARLELEYARAPRTSGATGDALLDAATLAISGFEASGDERWLGRALLLAGWIHGGRRGQHGLRQRLAERAVVHYGRAKWPTSTPAGEIANALYYGPTPVPEAIDRCRALLQDRTSDWFGRANIEVFLGGLVAQIGEFDDAESLIGSARAMYEEFGHRSAAATGAAAIRGDVQLLADDAGGAEQTFRWLCDELDRTEAYSHLASRAGDLAEALYRLGRLDESSDWVAIGESHTALDDVDARLMWLPVSGKLAAHRGDVERGLAVMSEAVALAETTDALNRRATIHTDRAEVLRFAGRAHEAVSALELAACLFESKGNLVGSARVRSLLADPTPA
jgi:tetratricopeptide (TPR) repeat protein